MESEYKLMWMMVMFDLPTFTALERKNASKFRLYLLDQGFRMAQFSVYMRFVGSREKTTALSDRIRHKLPPMGKITLMYITDKQFATMETFFNSKMENIAEKPKILEVF